MGVVIIKMADSGKSVYLPPLVKNDILYSYPFHAEPTETNIENATEINFVIENKEANAVIDTENCLIRSVIEIRSKMADGNGDYPMMTSAETECVPTNGFGFCLWENVVSAMGGNIVSSQCQNYPYMALINKLGKMTKGQQELDFSSDLLYINKDICDDDDQIKAIYESDEALIELKKGSLEDGDAGANKVQPSTANKTNISRWQAADILSAPAMPKRDGTLCNPAVRS